MAKAAQIAQALGVSLDRLTGLAQADHELPELARKLAGTLNEAHRSALEGHLRALLELAQGK